MIKYSSRIPAVSLLMAKIHIVERKIMKIAKVLAGKMSINQLIKKNPIFHLFCILSFK